MRYTIAVDFDGVLHSYTSPWTVAHEIPDPPVPGAIDWLNKATKKLEVVIHTTRGATYEGQAAIRLWLETNGYTGPVLEVTNEKVPALVYLDDRALRFDGSNFPSPEEVHQLTPWNKK